MGLLSAIINFFKRLFGGKKEETTVQKPENITTQPNSDVPMMTEGVFNVMTSGEDQETKDRLWKEMKEYESKDKFVYTLTTKKWEYNISYGQFIANPIYAKEPVVSAPAENVPKMSKTTFEFMTHGEDESTKTRLWNEMCEHEKKGEFVYTLRSDRWEYIIRNGQFIANPMYEKGNVVSSFKPKMTPATFGVMTSSEDIETKTRLWNEMCEHEEKGEFQYTLRTKMWEYIISNGQFTANPIYDKN